jgi:effector-binding domain-containing protein
MDRIDGQAQDEVRLMQPEVKVERREAIPVVSKRVLVTLAEIGNAIGPAFQEVYGGLSAHGLTPAGPPFVIYHGMPKGGTPFEIEVCAPIVEAGPKADAPVGWQIRELPAGTIATLLHVGPYDTLGEAYATIGAWIQSHRFAVSGPPREIYLSEPGTPPEQVQTVIEFPVAEVPAPITAA